MRGLLLDRRRGRGYGFDLGLSRPGGRGRIDEEGRELGSRERPVNVPEPSSGHGWRGCSVHHVAAAHVDTPYQVCLEPPAGTSRTALRRTSSTCACPRLTRQVSTIARSSDALSAPVENEAGVATLARTCLPLGGLVCGYERARVASCSDRLTAGRDAKHGGMELRGQPPRASSRQPWLGPLADRDLMLITVPVSQSAKQGTSMSRPMPATRWRWEDGQSRLAANSMMRRKVIGTSPPA
jgi:hypothetical protein